MSNCVLKFVKTHPNAKLPARNHENIRLGDEWYIPYVEVMGTHDSGYDIFCCEEKTIPARQAVKVETGIKVGYITPGYWFRIEARSGLGFKHKIFPHFGIVDNGFRGDMAILIYNTSDVDYTFKLGDRIAQLVIYPLINSEIYWTENIESTHRGDKSLGSSGK